MNASPPPPPSRAHWWLLVACVAVFYVAYARFPARFSVVGVNHYGVWFLDSYAILAANDALALGRDVYRPNPLDPFNRPHVYSRWWLGLGQLGLTRAHNPWIGFALGGGFLVAALALLRPRTAGEVAWYALFLCGPPAVLALDRANNDLVVFLLLAPVVPCLLAAHVRVRLLAVPLLAAAAGLKFYPAAGGLVLLAGAAARELRLRLLVAGVVFAAVGLSVAGDLARIGAMVPKAEGLTTFSSTHLLAAAGLRGGAATGAGLLLGALAIGLFLRTRIFSGWEIAPAHRAAWWSFVLGAVLLCACFFTGTNFGYRWIFAIWLAPLLWQLRRDPGVPTAVRRLARLTAALLVFALWFESLASGALDQFSPRVPAPVLLQWADRISLATQPITWALFLCLLGWLSHFARDGLRRFSGNDAPETVNLR